MKIELLIPQIKNKKKINIFSTAVSAGFPSPADDFWDKKLDLNEYLIKHPVSTFFVRVKGSSMKDSGIDDGDILVVDRSLEPKVGYIVIASIDGEFTVKTVGRINGELYLIPSNSQYKPIKINIEDDFQVFGVVTSVVKKLVG